MMPFIQRTIHIVRHSPLLLDRLISEKRESQGMMKNMPTSVKKLIMQSHQVWESWHRLAQLG